jgi:argininosuccinate lyase
MPQKKNPTILELIRAKTSRIDGNLIAVLGILKSLPSGYSSDLQEMKPIIWDSLDILLASIEVFTKTVGSLIIHGDKIAKATQESFVFAVDLAERLTLEGLLPFREAHNFVGGIINNMVSNGLKPQDLTLSLVETMADKILNHKIQISSSFLEECVNPIKCLNNRVSFGSPSSQNVELMLDELKNLVLKLEEFLAARFEKVETSRVNLRTLVNQYRDCKPENSVHIKK